jgi:hypothetical protein
MRMRGQSIGVIIAASFQIHARLTIHDHWPISFDDNEPVYSVLEITQLNNQRINQNILYSDKKCRELISVMKILRKTVRRKHF